MDQEEKQMVNMSTSHKAAILEIAKILSLGDLQSLRQSVVDAPGRWTACPKYAIFSKVPETPEEDEEQDKNLMKISKSCRNLWPEYPAETSIGRCSCSRGVPLDEVLRTIDRAIELKKELDRLFQVWYNKQHQK